MYQCESCGEQVPAGTSCQRVVVATRIKTYPRRARVIPEIGIGARRDRKKWKDDPGGVGTEIVRELKVCSACAERHRRR